MGVLASSGKFFFQFGITVFILSNIYIIVFNAYGYPVHPVLQQMSTVFKLLGFSTIVSGAIYVVSRGLDSVPVLGNMARVFTNTIAQAASYAVYLSLFGGAVTSISSLIVSFLQMIPLQPAITMAVAGVISIYASASMYYYMATRISGLPEE